MTIDDKIRDKKAQYDINIEAAKYRHFDEVKLIRTNILKAKKYNLLIKVEL